MAEQTPYIATAREMYDYIENWWGGEFDQELINAICNAPWDHIQAAANSLPQVVHAGPYTALPPLLPICSLTSPPGEPSGQRRRRETSMSLRLLTFTSEIVMNNRVMLPFNRLGYNGVEDHPGHREQLRADLGSMLSLRPLVSLGLIKFEPIQGMLPDSALWDEMQMASRLRPYYDAWIDLGLPIPTDPHRQFDFECTLAGATWYANKFGGTPLATNPVERLAWQAALEGKVNDTQIAKLQSLASLNLPDIRPNVASLAAIRSSSTAFSEWHLALSHSLGEVLPLGEDPLEVAKGTARFAAELRIALAAVEREISRSPALSAAQKGITSFSIAGLGASAAFALVTQQPWGALVGAAVTKTSETALEYVKARSELRQKRAIWDLVLAFDHDTRKRP